MPNIIDFSQYKQEKQTELLAMFNLACDRVIPKKKVSYLDLHYFSPSRIPYLYSLVQDAVAC